MRSSALVSVLFGLGLAPSVPAFAAQDLKVSIQTPKTESIRLTTEKQKGREVHFATYLVGANKIRERVVPSSIFTKMVGSFPRAILRKPSESCADVTVIDGHHGAVTLCQTSMTADSKAEFANWYKSVRDQIFD